MAIGPNAMRSALVVLGVVVALAAVPTARAATKVYMATWESSGSGVRVWSPGDASSTLLHTSLNGSGYGAMAVAVDSTSDHVYWAGQDNNQEGYVSRASAAASGTSTLMWTTSGAGYATDLVVHGDSGLAYWGWADGGVPAITVGPISGSTLAPTGNTPLAVASPVIALNTTTSRLYWTNSALGNQATDQATAPLFPARTSFTNSKAENASMQSMVANRAGTTMYSGTCATRATLASNPTCTGTIYAKAASAGTNLAPTPSGLSITGLTALAVEADDCILYGTAGGVLGRAGMNGCTASTLLTLPAGVRISSLWIVESPSASAAPTITGGSTVGSTLECSDAAWNADVPGARVSRMPTALRTFQWFLDGSPIDGGTAGSQVATSVGTYTCTTTGSNVAGPGTSTASAGHTVAAPTAAAIPTATGASPATAPTKLRVTWRLRSRTLTGRFAPVSGATSYRITATGATKRKGSCRASGKGAAKRIVCTIRLRAGRSTVTVSARDRASTVVARGATTRRVK